MNLKHKFLCFHSHHNWSFETLENSHLIVVDVVVSVVVVCVGHHEGGDVEDAQQKRDQLERVHVTFTCVRKSIVIINRIEIRIYQFKMYRFSNTHLIT